MGFVAQIHDLQVMIANLVGGNNKHPQDDQCRNSLIHC
jgi:hypothetical protein